ncbi:MAG: AAA family ATPase [Alphaproteobacteria bacterium]|nr:AAA family ATPase [Alphaproteobacteria bacterium]
MEAERILIIGNSGSGKTWLGTTLSQKMNIPLHHMDTLRWDKGGYKIRRSAADINKDLDAIQKQDQWILEGVFGKMVERCLPFSTLLIWLDLPWEDCKQNLLSRGPQFEDFLNSNEKEEALNKLIEWASEHELRTDANSWDFFNNLYKNFKHTKMCLRSREDMLVFLNREYEGNKLS